MGDGYQREAKHKENRVLQSEQNIKTFMIFFNLLAIDLNKLDTKVHLLSYQASTLPTVSGEKKPQDSRTSLDQTSFKKTYVYEIGPPSWIEKQINANTLKHRLVRTTFSLLNR